VLPVTDAPAPVFDAAFRDQLATLIRWRRDVRRFKPDPIPARLINTLIDTFDTAPSVGLSQPWRLVRVVSDAARAAIRANFETANAEALAAEPANRAGAYARLKLEGLDSAPEQLAVFAEPDPEQGHGLGRRTMPETVHASVAGAIMQFWLVARAHGVGVGWVSILDPDRLKRDLAVPAHWDLTGYLCVGYPATHAETPELERADWEHRRHVRDTLETR
jgi:5,6-dimethylbenzimidazole synthase